MILVLLAGFLQRSRKRPCLRLSGLRLLRTSSKPSVQPIRSAQIGSSEPASTSGSPNDRYVLPLAPHITTQQTFRPSDQMTAMLAGHSIRDSQQEQECWCLLQQAGPFCRMLVMDRCSRCGGFHGAGTPMTPCLATIWHTTY